MDNKVVFIAKSARDVVAGICASIWGKAFRKLGEEKAGRLQEGTTSGARRKKTFGRINCTCGAIMPRDLGRTKVTF
jgi:hypothetical protein